MKGHGDLAFQVVEHGEQLVVVRVDGRGRPRRVPAGDVTPFALDELRFETVARRARADPDSEAPTPTRVQMALFSEPHD